MYRIFVKDDISTNLSDVFLYRENKAITGRIDLEPEAADDHIYLLYIKYELDEETVIENDSGTETTIRDYLGL